MVKPCDICGDRGVNEAIIICYECKVAREHLYCMKVLRTQAPPFWRCDECEQNKLVSPNTTDDKHKIKKVSTLTALVIEGPNNNNLTSSKSNFKGKRVDKGRTKYLTCDEAVKLSSGSVKLNYTRKEFPSGHGISKTLSPPRPSQQQTGLKEKASPSMKSPACERPLIRSPQEERNYSAPSKRVESLNLEREMKTSNSSCKKTADVEAGTSDVGKPNLTSVSEMHDPYIPSVNSYCKGCFYVRNAPRKLNEEFKAHLPSRIHYKVYETTKKMPENIYLEVVHDEMRLEIFPADRDDIGLYFFPMFKRSENDITDFISRNNLVMKGNVEGVELFVLSSQVLPSHSQEFDGKYFLWGIFRRPRTTKTANCEPCVDDDVPPGFKNIRKQ